MKWSQSLGNSGGTVLLVKNQGPESDVSGPDDEDIVDRVGYGTGEGLILAEKETFDLESFEAGESIGRKWDEESQRYQDTDDNSGDFELQTPTPGNRNQAVEQPVPPPEPPPEIPEIIIEDAESVLNFGLSVSDDVTDATDAPSQNFPIAYVSHGDSVWYPDSLEISEDVTDPTDASPQNIFQAYISNGESNWSSPLEKQF